MQSPMLEEFEPLHLKSLVDGELTAQRRIFITNSGTPITSFVTVTARTEVGSTFIVPSSSEGLVIEPSYRKLGWHACDTHGISLQDVRVDEDLLLGQIRKEACTVPRGSRRWKNINCSTGSWTSRGLSERIVGLCQDSKCIWWADRQKSGGCIQVRRHGSEHGSS